MRKWSGNSSCHKIKQKSNKKNIKQVVSIKIESKNSINTCALFDTQRFKRTYIKCINKKINKKRTHLNPVQYMAQDTYHGQGGRGIGEWSASAILIPRAVAMVTPGWGDTLLGPLLQQHCCPHCWHERCDCWQIRLSFDVFMGVRWVFFGWCLFIVGICFSILLTAEYAGISN